MTVCTVFDHTDYKSIIQDSLTLQRVLILKQQPPTLGAVAADGDDTNYTEYTDKDRKWGQEL